MGSGSSAPPKSAWEGFRTRWKVLLIAVFAILIAWFTVVNSTEVSVNFFFVKAHTSLIFVILASVLLGMCLMAALWTTHAWKLQREKRTLQRQVAVLEEIQTVSQLHNKGDLEADAEDSSQQGPEDVATHD